MNLSPQVIEVCQIVGVVSAFLTVVKATSWLFSALMGDGGQSPKDRTVKPTGAPREKPAPLPRAGFTPRPKHGRKPLPPPAPPLPRLTPLARTLFNMPERKPLKASGFASGGIVDKRDVVPVWLRSHVSVLPRVVNTGGVTMAETAEALSKLSKAGIPARQAAERLGMALESSTTYTSNDAQFISVGAKLEPQAPFDTTFMGVPIKVDSGGPVPDGMTDSEAESEWERATLEVLRQNGERLYPRVHGVGIAPPPMERTWLEK